MTHTGLRITDPRPKVRRVPKRPPPMGEACYPIYLDDVVDTVADTVQHPSTDALISEMRSRIDDLREQLEAERLANEENRRIIAALTSRIPPAIEAPRESPQTAAEEPEGVDTPSTGAAPQEGSQPHPERSWWRRWFGFE